MLLCNGFVIAYIAMTPLRQTRSLAREGMRNYRTQRGTSVFRCRRRADFESAPHLLQSNPHSGNSNTKRYRFRAGSRLADWHTAAIVTNPEFEMRIRSCHCDRDLRRFRMTEHVREGLLNNSQHRALPLIGQLIDLGSNLEIDVQ